MPPVIVPNAPGAGHDHQTLDVPERQVLEAFREDIFMHHARLRLIHIANAVWIVATPTLDVYSTDFAGEEVTPLRRASAFPLGERPYFTFATLTQSCRGSASEPQLWQLSLESQPRRCQQR